MHIMHETCPSGIHYGQGVSFGLIAFGYSRRDIVDLNVAVYPSAPHQNLPTPSLDDVGQAYLPGTGSTVIKKAVSPGRGLSIALRLG